MERNNWLWRKSRCFASLFCCLLDFLCVLSLLLGHCTWLNPPFALLQPRRNSLSCSPSGTRGFSSPRYLYLILLLYDLCPRAHSVMSWAGEELELFHGAALCRGFETWPLDITSRSVKRSTRAGILLACISVDQREGLGELMPEPDVWCDKWFRGSDLFFREWNHTAGTVVLAKG